MPLTQATVPADIPTYNAPKSSRYRRFDKSYLWLHTYKNRRASEYYIKVEFTRSTNKQHNTENIESEAHIYVDMYNAIYI